MLVRSDGSYFLVADRSVDGPKSTVRERTVGEY